MFLRADHPFVLRLRESWQRLSDGLTLQQLWTEFQRETRASYGLYRTELEPHLEGASQGRRRGMVVRVLFWALLKKLSPPRRMVLILALLLLAAGLFQDSDLYLLIGIAGLLGLLGLELADRVAMKRDLQIAREIQGWLTPRQPPRVPGVDLAFATRPANTVAGDYYDAFLAKQQEGSRAQLLLVVADVAGKSMPAALLAATFQSSLRTLAQEALPLAQLVTRLNRYCCDHSLEGRRFTTAFVAELDPVTGELVYVNAGHNPPYLRRAAGAVETLEPGGLPLGVMNNAEYPAGRLTLAAGDLLVIYTDGVVDAQDPQGMEYGEERLKRLLAGAGAPSAEVMLQQLLMSVDTFTGTAPRFDDVTCLIARRTQDSGAEAADRGALDVPAGQP